MQEIEREGGQSEGRDKSAWYAVKGEAEWAPNCCVPILTSCGCLRRHIGSHNILVELLVLDCNSATIEAYIR
jgi:hypothetical protein